MTSKNTLWTAVIAYGLVGSVVTPCGLADDSSSREKIVYSSDFEAAVGKQWSKSEVGVTPVGERRFLGNFGPEKVTLSLKELPQHRFVRVSFDLYLIGSW